MVIISDYALRTNAQGEDFIALLLTGEVEMVKSTTSGKFYATTRKASVPCTFNETVAKNMIGVKMPGVICKVPCEPYLYLTDSGEEIEIDFTYEYRDEALEVVDHVLS